MGAYKIIKNPIFEYITIFVIVSNSLVLAMEDPTLDKTPPIFNTLDDIYLVLYSIEMVLKVKFKFQIFHRSLD